MEKSKWANLFINFSLTFAGVAVVSGILIFIISITGGSGEEISKWSAMLNMVFCICTFIPLFKLKKILKNIINKKTFIEENVRGFNTIAYPFFILAFISCFINNKDVGMALMQIGEIFAIKMETMIFITVGLVAFVMAYIFEEAINVKNEAENLREECKYTV